MAIDYNFKYMWDTDNMWTDVKVSKELRWKRQMMYEGLGLSLLTLIPGENNVGV